MTDDKMRLVARLIHEIQVRQAAFKVKEKQAEEALAVSATAYRELNVALIALRLLIHTLTDGAGVDGKMRPLEEVVAKAESVLEGGGV